MSRQNQNPRQDKLSQELASATVGTQQQAIESAVAVDHLDHPFFIWLDADLARLEKRFAHYATPISRRRGVPRR